MKRGVSVIIPTFNSARTLEKTLISVKKQNIDQKNIEILVIDGGSSDKTIKIAKKFRAVVLRNTRTQQEYAKYIGMLFSRKKYVLFLDSDEQLSSKNSIANRIDTLQATRTHIVFSSGYKPKTKSLINEYVATFGDPFAYFMYNTSPNYMHYVNDCKKNYKNYIETKKYISFQIEKGTFLPVVDLCAGVMIDMEYINDKFDLKSDVLYVPQLPSLIMRENKRFVVVKHDYIIHDSAESYSHFTNKLMWRSIVNIHYKNIPGTGYSNRENYQPTWFNTKKFLFIPYAFSGLGPLSTTLSVLILRKNLSALLHMPLTVFVAFSIIKNLFFSLVGHKPKLHIYGKVGNLIKL